MPIIPHIDLARKIATRITTDAPITYSTLEARAVEKGIDPNLFQQAMAIIHRSKLIECKTQGDEIVYTIKVVKEPVKLSGAEWVTKHYPWPGQNGIPVFEMPFPEIDMSHLFLTGEELEKYKCEAKGRPYIPGKKKAYEHAR